MFAAMQNTRAGFTLIEVLIAIVIIDVALLALVAGTAALVRETAELRIKDQAIQVATNRVQALGSGACTPVAGSSTSAGLHEEWITVVQPNRVRDIRDSVTFTVAGARRSLTLRTRLPC